MSRGTGKRKHRPPSRIRYDRENPVLGTRVSRELYDGVQKVLKKNGWSYAKFVRVAMGHLKADYKSAWDAGYAAAKDMYGIPYACHVCGGLIWALSDEEQDAAGTALTEAGWSHSECINET